MREEAERTGTVQALGTLSSPQGMKISKVAVKDKEHC